MFTSKFYSRLLIELMINFYFGFYGKIGQFWTHWNKLLEFNINPASKCQKEELSRVRVDAIKHGDAEV